eukprot:6379082-Prymnesium_polylepis.1
MKRLIALRAVLVGTGRAQTLLEHLLPWYHGLPRYYLTPYQPSGSFAPPPRREFIPTTLLIMSKAAGPTGASASSGKKTLYRAQHR